MPEIDSVLYCAKCDDVMYQVALVRYPDEPTRSKFQLIPTKTGLPVKPENHKCPGCQAPLRRKGIVHG